MAGEPNITITGNLAADPELRPVGDTHVAVFRVGSTPWRTVEGQRENGTTLWLDVEAWGTLGEQVAENLSKGNTVVVDGVLMQDEWTNDEGEVRSRFKLRASNVGVDVRFQNVTVEKTGHSQSATPVQTTAKPKSAAGRGKKPAGKPAAKPVVEPAADAGFDDDVDVFG